MIGLPFHEDAETPLADDALDNTDRIATMLKHGPLFDVQFQNEHIRQFGVVEIEADRYLERFEAAAMSPCDWPIFD